MKKVIYLSLIGLALGLTGCYNQINANTNQTVSDNANEQSVNQNINQATVNQNQNQNTNESTTLQNLNSNRSITDIFEDIDQTLNLNVAIQTGSTIEPIDGTWELYTNYDLGFSLKVLKEVESYGELEIIEDGDIVYLVGDKEYSYDLILESLASTGTDFERVQGIPWAILVKEVSNDSELDNFLKQKYGSGCSLGEKTVSGQTGVFDIQIQGDGKNLGETECPLNFATIVKYTPSKGLVASWDIGQDVNFFVDGEGVDNEMIESFQFIE